jgi:hypothetical protein
MTLLTTDTKRKNYLLLELQVYWEVLRQKFQDMPSLALFTL